MKKITYSSAGDNYNTKDPIKKLAQKSALATAQNLQTHGYKEMSGSRGESAYVFSNGKNLYASVIEGLGTKNLIADEVRNITGKTYYDAIAHDTIATIINDLVSVGARPLVVHAYWAIGSNIWLENEQRMKDLITGFKKACDISMASWGGGETPTLKGVINKKTIVLGGSAFGIIGDPKNYLNEQRLEDGDRIILIKSNGLNTNGASLVRAIAKKLPKGYAQNLVDGKMFGEEALRRSNIYARLIKDLLENDVDIHYISHITGHGLRKIMRAKACFTYFLEKIAVPSELFQFIQKKSGLSDYEMYSTFNMGQDYALFVNPRDTEKILGIIKMNKFQGFDAGFIQKGERKVVIRPLNMLYEGNTLDLRT